MPTPTTQILGMFHSPEATPQPGGPFGLLLLSVLTGPRPSLSFVSDPRSLALPACVSLLVSSLMAQGLPNGSDVEESVCNAGAWDAIHGSGRSPGEGTGNSLLYLSWHIHRWDPPHNSIWVWWSTAIISPLTRIQLSTVERTQGLAFY